MKNSKGFSLVEVLVTIGLLGIISAGITSMILSQNKQTRALAENLAAQDLYKSMISGLSNSEVCKFILSKHRYDTQSVMNGRPYKTNLGNEPIYMNMSSSGTPGMELVKKGDQASAYSSSLFVSGIFYELTSGTVSGSKGSFKGRWILEFDSTKTVRPMKPLSVSSLITLNVTNSGAADIISCMNEAESSFATQSCDDTEVVTGYDEFGQVICKPNYPSCPAGQAYNGSDASGNPICIFQVIVGGCPANSVIKSISANAPPDCVTTTPVNALCGSANGQTLNSAPTNNLCAAGSPTQVNGTGPWSWACAGVNGGATSSCLAYATPLTCGSSNGTTSNTAPTSNLCGTGATASIVNGSGPWTWTCTSTSGNTINCRTEKTPEVIFVTQATYGGNCPGVPQGNVTANVRGRCNGLRSCSFIAGNGTFGDPYDGCRKTFTVSYACGVIPKSQSYGPRKYEGYSVTLFCN